MSFYQPNIPLPDDFISVSQGDIQGNFEETNNFVKQNHEVFNSPNFGKHKFVSLQHQNAFPVTIADEIALVNHDDFVTQPTPQLFFRGENKAALDPSTRLTATPGIAARCIFRIGNLKESYNIKSIIFTLRDEPLIPIGRTRYNVQFKKALKNTDYTVIITPYTDDGSMYPAIVNGAKTTTGFEFGFCENFNLEPALFLKAAIMIFGEIADE